MKTVIALASLLVLVSPALAAPPPVAQPVQRTDRPFQLAGDTLAVPMGSWHGRSLVSVTIDGHGPFPFVLDTGAGGSLVSRALADSLGLPVVGETQVSSPLGGTPASAKVVRIGELTIGGKLRGALTVLALDLPAGGPSTHWGVLSPYDLAGLLVTWDLPRQQFRFRRGALPAPDEKRVYSYGNDMLPNLSVQVAGRHVRVHVDTGSPRGLMLPVAWKDSLPLAAPPTEGPEARTVNRSFRLLQAKLDGKLVVAGREYVDPELTLSPAGDIGNIGVALLRDFEVTLDASNRRFRMELGTTR
jgi:hypothetical protein